MSITPSVAVDNIEQSSMPTSNGKTLYVGGSGEGNYSSIQDAINASSYGDIVFVYNGTYYENVVINQHGISLIGEDKETTIIDGGGINSVILIVKNNDWVTISGFTIQNSGDNHWDDAGIEIRSCCDIITGNIIRNNPKHGIILGRPYFESYSNDITQNIIIDSEWGITIDESCLNDIYENYIVNNSVGIFVGSSILPTGDIFPSLGCKSLTLYEYENYIFRNMIKNNIRGIVIEPWWNTHIFENNIIENDMGIGLDAPWMTSCNENYIYQNNIINNDCGISFPLRIGRQFSEEKNNEIHHNNFINNRHNAEINGDNKWDANYWDNWIGVKIKLPIFQRFPKILFSFFKFNFDWHPAKEPYDIEGVI